MANGKKLAKRADGGQTGAKRHMGNRPAAGHRAKWRETATNQFTAISNYFLILVVLAFCISTAVRIGVFEQQYSFQESSALILVAGNSQPEAAYSFAKGSDVITPTDGKNLCESQASFRGNGEITGAKIKTAPDGFVISEAYLNGEKLCGPCREGISYMLGKPVRGEAHLLARTGPAVTRAGNSNKTGSGFAFLSAMKNSATRQYAQFELEGNWASTENTAIPSTFYGVDAPFHINRAGQLAAYLFAFKWPMSQYTYLSAIPPAFAVMVGATPEYAYKLWEIALFLLPVAIFYLLSRKMPAGKDAVFAISSLFYLCFPVTGLLTGGGPDLFMYGMTAHTLATQLSLVFFFFAYDYCAEKKSGSLLPAALFFMLAFLSNQRIIVALGFLASAAAIPAVLRKDFRRVIIFAACLAASIAWQAVPFATTANYGGYGTLGGAAIRYEGEWLAGVIQSGYLILPAMFLVGVAWAFRRKCLMPLLLAGAAFMTLLFASSPGVNRMFPFIDGIRFMSSFFLPAFFIAGLGWYAVLAAGLSAYRDVAKKRGWDTIAVGGAVAIAIFIPLASVFFVAASTTADFYRMQADSLALASERVSFDDALGAIGSERALFLAGMKNTQYPLSTDWRQRFYFAADGTPEGAASQMMNLRLRYLIIGSAKSDSALDGGTASRSDEYIAFRQDSRFDEIPLKGSVRLFRLKEGEAGADYFADGAVVSKYSVMAGRAAFAGVCEKGDCAIEYFAGVFAQSSCRNFGNPCGFPVGREGQATMISGIPQGAFDLAVEPENPDYFYPLVLACAIAGSSCYALSRE